MERYGMHGNMDEVVTLTRVQEWEYVFGLDRVSGGGDMSSFNRM